MDIYLRALEIEDYKITSKWRNDPEVTGLLGGNSFFVSSVREKTWVEDAIMNDRQNLRLGIALKNNDKLIGIVNLTNIEAINRKAEISIMIGDKEEWGKSYGKFACLKMLEFGFLERDLERIYAIIDKEHLKSISMFEKIGFKQEGLMRNHHFKKGDFKDAYIYSILKSEYVSNL